MELIFESCAPRLLFVFGFFKNEVDILSHGYPDSLFPSLCNCNCKMLQQIEGDLEGKGGGVPAKKENGEKKNES